MRVFNSMEITADRNEVLAALRKNRETHKKIVKEARGGYMQKARQALEQRLVDLQSGKLVSLSFTLQPPQDYTKVYDTAIRMLELHTGDEVALDSQQVRTLVMDEWDWTQAFFAANMGYSGTAQEVGAARGY